MIKSIRNRYALTLNLYVGLIIIVLSYVLFNITSATIENIQSRNQVRLNEFVVERLNEVFSYNSDILKAESKRFISDSNDRDAISKNLQLVVDANNLFSSLVFINDDMIVSTDKNYDIEYEFYDVDSNSDIVISKPFYDSLDNEYYIGMSYDIEENDTYYGRLMGFIDLSEMNRTFSFFKSKGSSEAWITDSDGMVLSFYEENQQLRDISYKYEVLTDNSEFIVEEFWGNNHGSLFFSSKSEGIDYLLTYSVIENFPQWKVSILTEFEDVQIIARGLSKVILIAMLILIVLTIILSRLIASSAVKPIEILTKAVKTNSMAETTSDIERRSDEITVLFQSYNTMKFELDENSKNLEKQVLVRTKELEEANNELYNLATTDTLTGAMNRLQIINELESLIFNIDDIQNGQIAVLFIDLNNFKYYNDTFGHDIGDQLLIEVTKLLKSGVRESDYIGRYGGDQFIVLLPGGDEVVSNRVMKGIDIKLRNIENFKTYIEEWLDETVIITEEHRLGLSIGIAIYFKGSDENADEVIKRADEAMYIEKIKSKNRK